MTAGALITTLLRDDGFSHGLLGDVLVPLPGVRAMKDGRLIVCSTRYQQDSVRRKNPLDTVVIVGDVLYGLRVTEILDLTNPKTQSEAEHDRDQEWWEHAQCRIYPVASRED